MDETLKQLGELLLGSVPTVIFLVLTYLAYTVLVHKPLSRILSERHERTEGAVAKARADVAAAEARTAEYEQRLREARLAVFRTQEQKRQQAAQLRASAVAEARTVPMPWSSRSGPTSLKRNRIRRVPCRRKARGWLWSSWRPCYGR